MFFNFVDELRAAGIPASFKEHLVLLEALDKDVIEATPEAFYYLSRATNYVNLFRDDGEGVENKWLAAKNEDGTWTRSKIDVFAFHDDYTETTPLNMAFSVPQDGQGLANLYGGRAALAEKLDTLFENNVPAWKFSSTKVNRASLLVLSFLRDSRANGIRLL